MDARFIWLADHPNIFFPLMRAWFAASAPVHAYPPRLTGPTTDLVIEGFPRSGNTFALVAFARSQPKPIEIAHHVHSPSQVIRAVELGVPSLVLLRDPVDAVLSWVLRQDDVSVDFGLRAWITFYRSLLPLRDGFVLAPFDDVTTDFGEVVRRVNERFGTTFTEFVHTTESSKACFEVIDQLNKRVVGREGPSEMSVARPSESREMLRRELETQLLATPKRRSLVKDARDLFETLL